MLDEIIFQAVGSLEALTLPNFSVPAFTADPVLESFSSLDSFSENSLELLFGKADNYTFGNAGVLEMNIGMMA